MGKSMLWDLDSVVACSFNQCLYYRFISLTGFIQCFAVRGGVYFLPQIYCLEVVIQTLV